MSKRKRNKVNQDESKQVKQNKGNQTEVNVVQTGETKQLNLQKICAGFRWLREESDPVSSHINWLIGKSQGWEDGAYQLDIQGVMV